MPCLSATRFAAFYRHGWPGKIVNKNCTDNHDELVKISKLLAAVIPALDNNTQGQAAAGIQ